MTLEDVLQYPEDQQNLELKRKIDSITQYCSKPYFKEALKKLAIANPESANIICEYIIAEQNEMNIKESTNFPDMVIELYQ